MTTIFVGQTEPLIVQVVVNGQPVSIDPDASISAQLLSPDGQTVLAQSVQCVSTTPGADFINGYVAVQFQQKDVDNLPVGGSMLVLTSSLSFVVKRFWVNIEQINVPERSQLFVKDFVVDELRQNALILLAQSLFPTVNLTDDYIWSKVLAGEASIEHMLRVPLVPTQFFPAEPTPDQIAALPANMPWRIDPPYDSDPSAFEGDKWGFIKTNNRPIQSVQLMRYVYPSPVDGLFDIPGDWLRIDPKYGEIRVVPTSLTIAFPLAAFMISAASSGRTVPQMIQLTYVAGIANAWKEYPDLIDVIKKKAILLIIQDAFLPQSGSISADGLSQSLSVDLLKYNDIIETIINGPKGQNGGLMAQIHGVRLGVVSG